MSENRIRKQGYRRAPGLSPASLADMAADELSQSLLRSPAARVEEAPLVFPPRLPLHTPPGGRAGGRPPATAEHRARAAREEAQRADDHRVRVLTPPGWSGWSGRSVSLLGRPLTILRRLRRHGNGSEGKGKTERSFARAVWSVYLRRSSPGVGRCYTWSPLYRVRRLCNYPE